ncbi:cytochrome ubiquinol oxidase subunit I [Azospirillum rugosum]|uniref:Cytochrome d ubiquinol oxidase subunit I n=1 Tax=Azospirillum rugosum TaxID=416170 RepID=A0ABS4SRD0_9PROT|nr:cytochrome ubiquinol oxidase subunit I [Azospirillum rugosum]MBP2294502.1 cytochrome d ubiquinol oxidase subunit I [Azospirillum rugosum]MDQ0529007.1 cytochrome d ubiquinol oxidase subunit I [Azospirillum rugosum]
MDLDPLILSRIQFAFVISFHILFPAFTVGLACWIAVLEARWLMSGRALYRSLAEFWTKIFAISFGMGVVSGIVMTYQFGTNWARWSDVVGNVLGPLIQYEVVTAFFLEAAFLGILLFGRDRVPRGIHFMAAVLVATGTVLSSFWILSANSWMHTPAGAELRDGRFYVTDWWQVVFNPSFPYRLTHMLTAMFLTTSFVVAGISAFYLIRNRFLDHARVGLSMALGLITILAPLQIFLGDLHGLNTLEHQPAKIAAMEGNWEGGTRAPLVLFAIPDVEQEKNHLEVGIPALSSLILTHDFNGAVPGLKQFPADQRPDPRIIFWTFRIMVGIGLLMLAVALVHLVLRVMGRLYTPNWFHRVLVACMPIGFVAILAGWFTTEIGRQPWVVYGHLRTSDAVTPALTGGAVLVSLVTFMVVYTLIYGFGTYYLIRILKMGPAVLRDEDYAPQAVQEAQRPKRPLSLPGESIEPAE